MTIESMIEHKEKIPETLEEVQIFSEPKVAVTV